MISKITQMVGMLETTSLSLKRTTRVTNLITICLIFSALTASAGDLVPKIYVNGVENGSMRAHAPAKWEFSFLDNETGHPPHHFHEMHTKPMHLIVVSQDFSSFAHIHPKLGRMHAMKSFSIDVNTLTADPDNFQLPKVTPHAGRYFLFGEIMPMEYGMLTYPFTVEVTPNLEPVRTPTLEPVKTPMFVSPNLSITPPWVLQQSLITPSRLAVTPAPVLQPAPQNAQPVASATRLAVNQTFTQYYDIDGLHVDDPERATYQAQINIEPIEHCGVVVPKLNIRMSFRQNVVTDDGANLPTSDEDRTHTAVAFQPVMDLEPWLDSYAHSIVLGYKGETAAEKTVQHLHAAWPIASDDITKDERGPDLEMVAHSHGKSTPSDIYRAWVQFKRHGRVVTLAFDFDWQQGLRPTKRIQSFCAPM